VVYSVYNRISNQEIQAAKGEAMTDLGVKSCTSITFGNEVEVYTIPDELCIDPQFILDEKEGVYRVSISQLEEQMDEATDALYQRLFSVLDKKKPFVDNMHIAVGDTILTLKLAYIIKTMSKYGTFYDIEATIKDIKYTKGETIEQT
jgi:hypothetical protein